MHWGDWRFMARAGAPAGAQDWPAKQVNFIVPFSAGGTTDLFGRLLAQHMQQKFGQPFIVENRAGAGGNLGAGAVAKAAPDGYTFLVGTVSTHAINPFLYSKLPLRHREGFPAGQPDRAAAEHSGRASEPAGEQPSPS